MSQEIKSALLQCQIIDSAAPEGAAGRVLARVEMPVIGTNEEVQETLSLIHKAINMQQFVHRKVNESNAQIRSVSGILCKSKSRLNRIKDFANQLHKIPDTAQI